jgi:hypothetical protein
MKLVLRPTTLAKLRRPNYSLEVHLSTERSWIRERYDLKVHQADDHYLFEYRAKIEDLRSCRHPFDTTDFEGRATAQITVAAATGFLDYVPIDFDSGFSPPWPDSPKGLRIDPVLARLYDWDEDHYPHFQLSLPVTKSFADAATPFVHALGSYFTVEYAVATPNNEHARNSRRHSTSG